MYISLWVLIPLALILLYSICEGVRKNATVETLSGVIEGQTQDIDALREALKRQQDYADRAAKALNHVQDIAWTIDSQKMQDAARQALTFYYDETQDGRDDPRWRD